MDELDLTFVDDAVSKIGTGPEKVLELLQAIQGYYGYLPESALKRVCELTEITPASIMGVSSFYNQFRHRPVGKHIIHVCVGTACHVKGASLVYDAFLRHLGIVEDEDTDADKQFTVEKIACLGCCTLAPAVQIDQVTYGHMTSELVGKVIDDFLRYESVRGKQQQRTQEKDVDGTGPFGEIRIGLGSCCVARGSGKLNEALHEALDETGIKAAVKQVGCVGMCHQTPLLEVILPNNKSHLYARVEPADAKSILLRHFRVPGFKHKIANAASRALDNILTDEKWEPVTRYSINVREEPVSDFLGKQRHIATEYCGVIDPVDIEEYISRSGFEALRKCVGEVSPENVIGEIERSGLRGRGGAGYPTHLKWSAVRGNESEVKYVVCNGDEGDPGAFMDRMLMESYPYRIIEGVTIAAYTVGARQGYFYIRAEYPLAIARMSEALDRCRQLGVLGDKVLGSDFSLDLKIVAGAGAFVCGEETALMASIEGRRGMPRLRPPYPAEKGLWAKPTLINNVETYAVIPWIIRQGAAEFARLGTQTSKGTKVFALAGKIARGGLIEVPMGISIREIIEDIGGGIEGGKRFKAVQIGGPSGGCVAAKLADASVDYETLNELGAIMGSGGTRRMLDILERLCDGRGRKGDIENLEQLALMVKKGSICGLGGTAPNPVLSTLAYFRDEYEAHIAGRCPAGRCRSLITYSVTDDCIGCTLCAQHCPADAIAMQPYAEHEIDVDKCIRCGTCKSICPVDAIKVE